MKLSESGKYFFACYFSCLSEFSVVFNISSSQTNANLSSRHFLYENCLISKYLSILHALLQLQSEVLEFHIQSFL